MGACISDEPGEVHLSNNHINDNKDSNHDESQHVGQHQQQKKQELTEARASNEAALPESNIASSDSATDSNAASSDHGVINDDAKAQARSERKRCREKQRRVDVNKQFSDLMNLINFIEEEEKEEDPSIIRLSYSASNRADLIARAIAHLERLRDSNKRRRTEIATLQQQLQETKKAGEDVAARLKEALCSNNKMMVMPQPNKQVCRRRRVNHPCPFFRKPLVFFFSL